MKMEDKLDFLELFRDIHEIKHKEREGWKKIGVKPPRDTIASHSFGTMIVGWLLAEKEGFDSEKIIKTLLIHDLIMAYLPDYTPEDEKFNSKKEIEKERTEKLLNDVPEEIRDEFEELLNELQGQNTDLARFAKECDKIETLLQALIYSEDLEENHLEEFLNSYKNYFETETGKHVFNELRKMSKNL